MQQHVRSVHLHSVHSPPPNRSYTGAKGTITTDSYAMMHVRKCNEAQHMGQGFRGIAPKIDQNNFVYSEMKKSRENMQQSDHSKLKPHVGHDALLFDHHRNMKQTPHKPASSISTQRTMLYQAAAPKVGADAFTIARASMRFRTFRLHPPCPPPPSEPSHGLAHVCH